MRCRVLLHYAAMCGAAQLVVVRPIDTPHQSLLWGPCHHGAQGEPRGNPGLSQQSSSAPGTEHFCYTHFDKNPMIRPTDQADVPAPTLIILHLPRISLLLVHFVTTYL